MIYLSGCIVPSLSHPQLGWMVTPDMGNRLPDHGYFAIDCGMYGLVQRGIPEKFDMARYERFIEKKQAEAGDRLLFVVTPDMPFSADGTIEAYERYGQRTKATGARTAFVTQDGMQSEDIPWRDVDAIFVGGSTEWKLGQESVALMSEAHRRGKWVHVGRVNSGKKFRAAVSAGADSADGTFLKYGLDYNWRRLKGWLDMQTAQPSMVLR